MKRPPLPNSASPSTRLRIIETTDLHMQLLDYDYFSDTQNPAIGLISLADQIAELRKADGVTALLCDNGDLLQGNPLADYLATHLKPGDLHPMIGALNLLEYDAMTLGNHEFDYGLDFLRNTLSQAAFSVVSANIADRDGAPLVRPFVIKHRVVPCSDGVDRALKVGITGFGPPQITDRDNTNGTVKVRDVIMAAQEVVPEMQAAGADIIVALCHSGIGAAQHLPRMENAALPLARVDGIDVLLLGHTHDHFPNQSIPNTGPVDHARGRLYGKPAVMAAFCGTALGVIDLDLRWTGKGWVPGSAQVRLHQPRAKRGSESGLCKSLRALVAEPHEAARDEMRKPIARADVPIASYFATVQPELSQQLLARAMKKGIETALQNGPFADLPVLAAKSSFRFGGRSGLGHYIDIPPGPVTLRDAAAIFPFADTLCAVRRNGAQLRLWLERSAAHYNTIHPGQSDQTLIHPQSAAYNCDTIFGLSYEVDLTQPARFDTYGVEVEPHAARIRHMMYEEQPVADTDTFIVATNSFRANGGGGFPPIGIEDILYMSKSLLRDALIAYLQDLGTITEPVHPTWAFSPIVGASAIFASAPQAQQHLSGQLTHIGPRPDGFATYRLTF